MTATPSVDELRARWDKALHRERLASMDQDDFMLGGLGGRVRLPTVRLLLLPSDPFAEVVEFDGEFWQHLKKEQARGVVHPGLRLGDFEEPTAHAAVMVKRDGCRGDKWSSYLGVHRSGAVEYGFGDHGGWESTNDVGVVRRTFNLVTIVAHAWSVLDCAATQVERAGLDGPQQLAVAVRNSEGGVLSNFAAGWAEPNNYDNHQPPCSDPHLLWHIELDGPPTAGAAQTIAYEIGDRLENAWGSRNRRYLAQTGNQEGQVDLSKIR